MWLGTAVTRETQARFLPPLLCHVTTALRGHSLRPGLWCVRRAELAHSRGSRQLCARHVIRELTLKPAQLTVRSVPTVISAGLVGLRNVWHVIPGLT